MKLRSEYYVNVRIGKKNQRFGRYRSSRFFFSKRKKPIKKWGVGCSYEWYKCSS